MLSLIYKEMKEMREQDSKVSEYMKSNSNQMKNMEAQQKAMDFQLGQLATTVGNMQNKGKFPSTTETNPKEYCKAIELRSGTKYQGPQLSNEDDNEEKTAERVGDSCYFEEDDERKANGWCAKDALRRVMDCAKRGTIPDPKLRFA
ncbi:hypothetical protein ACS0TY_026432 [Phlomoides rotata]